MLLYGEDSAFHQLYLQSLGDDDPPLNIPPTMDAGPDPAIYRNAVNQLQKSEDRFRTIFKVMSVFNKKAPDPADVTAMVNQCIDLQSCHHQVFLLSQEHSNIPIAKHIQRLWNLAMHDPLRYLIAQQAIREAMVLLAFSYSLIMGLLDQLPSFRADWAEVLGHLCRFFMNLSPTVTQQVRWNRMARRWYHEVARLSPQLGRTYQHFALTCHRYLEVTFYYCKAQLSFIPAEDAARMFKSTCKYILTQEPTSERGVFPTELYFAHTMSVLFTESGPAGTFDISRQKFISGYGNYIRSSGQAAEMNGAQVAMCLFTAVLNFRKEDRHIAQEYLQTFQDLPDSALLTMAPEHLSRAGNLLRDVIVEVASDTDRNINGSFMHAILAGLRGLASVRQVYEIINNYVPWQDIEWYLDDVLKDYTLDPDSVMEGVLPEDRALLGFNFMHSYFNDLGEDHWNQPVITEPEEIEKLRIDRLARLRKSFV